MELFHLQTDYHSNSTQILLRSTDYYVGFKNPLQVANVREICPFLMYAFRWALILHTFQCNECSDIVLSLCSALGLLRGKRCFSWNSTTSNMSVYHLPSICTKGGEREVIFRRFRAKLLPTDNFTVI